MTSESSPSINTTREGLDRLLEQRDRLLKLAIQVGDMKPPFAERLESLDEQIREAQGLYTLSLLESLNSESKKLTKLTAALIGLTIILALLALPSFILFLRTIG